LPVNDNYNRSKVKSILGLQTSWFIIAVFYNKTNIFIFNIIFYFKFGQVLSMISLIFLSGIGTQFNNLLLMIGITKIYNKNR